MFYPQLTYILLLFLITFTVVFGKWEVIRAREDLDHFHVLVNNPFQKMSQGWQLPGLLRPKFIIDRHFAATKDRPAYFDRKRVKLMEDNSVYVYGKRRPWISLTDSTAPPKVTRTSISKLQLDGGWSIQYTINLNNPDFELDIRNKDGLFEHHKSVLNWGETDEYASTICPGTIHAQTFISKRLPYGYECVGTFQARVSPHRPVISREFQGFQ